MKTNHADQSPFVAIVSRAAVQSHTQTEKEIDDQKRGGGQSKAELTRRRILYLIFQQIRVSTDIEASHEPIDTKQRIPRNKGHLQQTDRQAKNTALEREFRPFLIHPIL
jgi:hypothetical protein